MADDKQVDFVDGVSPVTEAFLDRIQETNQGLAWNLNVTISGTSIVVPAGTLENVASIIIKGKMRYISAPVSINFAGFTVGTYGIWANTTSTDSSTPFTIQAVLGSAAPSGVTYTRKIATVYWSGATLQDLTLLAPYTKHASMHRPGGPDPLGTAVVGSNEIMDGAVGTSEIATGSVTPVKLSDELMNRPFLLWEYQNNDVVFIENLGFGPGAIARGAVMYSSGADEPVGYRTASGSVIGSGGTFVDTLHAIVAYYDAAAFSGWNFQIRMSARYMWGGKAGCTFTSMRLRFNNDTALSFTYNPFNPTVSGVASSTTDWVVAPVHADEFNGPGWLQYLVSSTGVNVHWTLQYVRLEGRYLRV